MPLMVHARVAEGARGATNVSIMQQRTFFSPKSVIIGLLAVLGVLGLSSGAVAQPQLLSEPVAGVERSVQSQAGCGDTTGFERVALSELPPQADHTVELIQQGGPYPYPEDGGVFHNWEGFLPECPEGYYHEYTVETPGVDHRGARRFVVGDGGEYFYTADHYESFRLTDIHA